MTQSKVENAIFITGAGQRIGAYLVKQFLKQTSYPVIFSYRTHKPQVDELVKLGAIAIQSDFNEVGALPQLVTSIQDRAVSLRAVIHNASVWLSDEQAPVSSQAYNSLFKVHVETPIYLNEELHPLLMRSSSALRDIISLSDFSVAQPKAETSAYLASKAALQNASVAFAKKYAPNIKVNDIAPGLIIFNEGDSEEYKQKRLQQSAIWIEPGEEVIWQAVRYLMESPYTTGISLPVNGGSHLL